MNEKIMTEINALVADTRNIIVCSIDKQGYPNSKAMFKTIHEGLKNFYFSTNTSAMRTQQANTAIFKKFQSQSIFLWQRKDTRINASG